MVVTKSGAMFVKLIDDSREVKNKDFIVKHIRGTIMEVGYKKYGTNYIGQCNSM